MLYEDRQYGDFSHFTQSEPSDNYVPNVYAVQSNHRVRDYVERLSGEKCPCSQKLPLTNYDAIPLYLKGNSWVERGYRVNYSAKNCIFSAFQCSNEFINIWSHMLGFLLFVATYLYDVLHFLPKQGAQASDYAIITATVAMFGYCMLCSAGFHLFNSHSERCYAAWLAVDVSGVTIAALGCYLSGVYYGFYCYPAWRNVYASIIGVSCVVVLSLQVYDAFVDTQKILRRVFLFTFLACIAALPVTHWIVLEGGFSPTVRLFLPNIVIMYFLLMLATLIYLSKFPERFWPGVFDYFGHSHNLWHVIVVAALSYWHGAGLRIIHFMLNSNCNDKH